MTRGAPAVPATWLEALAVRLVLGRAEWRIVALVLASYETRSIRQIAQKLRLDYSAVKRAVRGLVGWNVLRRGPDGLVFQPDVARWGPPDPPAQR